MFVVAVLLGGGYGFISSFLHGGFWMWAIVYFLGVGAGNLIHKVVGFKIGPKVIATATIGVIAGSAVGIAFSPMNLMTSFAEQVQNEPQMQAQMKAQEYMQNAWAEWSEKDKTHADVKLAAAQDAAQKRLAELVGAAKKGDTCYVLAANNGEGTAKRYDFMYVRSATDDALLCAPMGENGMRTVPKEEVLDWAYVDKTTGFQAAAPQAQSVKFVRSETQREQFKAAQGLMQAYSFIDLIVFVAGVITVMSGQAPAFRFPFFRR
jgi:hypothetical protein